MTLAYQEQKETRKSFPAYKYSSNGKGQLYEAVILEGEAAFLSFDFKNDQIDFYTQIEESSRILRAPDMEEYPYEPYVFEDRYEVIEYLVKARNENIYTLYKKAIDIVKKYNEQDDYKLILIATDIVWSYFQDRFSTTHYVGVVGDNGSGKSTIGDTFEAAAYRPVNMTDPSGANLFRTLGTIEPAQCTIIADEAEKIGMSSDIMAILKTGYHIKKKVAKINTNTWKQEHFYTYSLKIIIAEKSPSQSTAKGVLDRTFLFNTYKGKPEYDIKEILNPQGNPKRQQLLDDLTNFRKLMLIYRLLHFKDTITDIDIGLDGRDKELCKPLIQLFYNTEAQSEIEKALQKFIDEKNQRKESTFESAMYSIIADLVSENYYKIPASIIWEKIKSNIQGYYNEKNPNEYQTSEYGTIYRNTITNIIRDKFAAEIKHKRTGNILIFDTEKFAKAGTVYNTNTGIQTKLTNYDNNDNNLLEHNGEGCEGCEGITDSPSVFSESSDIESYNNNPENNINITTNMTDTSNNCKVTPPNKPSIPLTSSPNAFTAFTPSHTSEDQNNAAKLKEYDRLSALARKK